MLLRRYVCRTLIRSFWTILACATLLQFFINWTHELGSLREDSGHHLMALTWIACLQVPGNLYTLVPILILVAVLWGLGQLSRHMELQVIRQSGFSPLALMLWVLRALAPSVLALIFIGEGLGPLAYTHARRFQHQSHEGHLLSGLWFRHPHGISYIGHLEDQHAEDLYRFEWEGTQELKAAHRARHAVYEQGQWHASEISRTFFGGDRLRRQEDKEALWPHTPSPLELLLTHVPADTLGLTTLYRALFQDEKIKHLGPEYPLIFWQKIAKPLWMLWMMMLATYMSMGPFSRLQGGVRAALGMTLGFFIHTFENILAHFFVSLGTGGLCAALAPCLFAFFVLSLKFRKLTH